MEKLYGEGWTPIEEHKGMILRMTCPKCTGSRIAHTIFDGGCGEDGCGAVRRHYHITCDDCGKKFCPIGDHS